MSKKNSSESKDMSAYIIVNETLKMSKGKIASQSAHGILSMHRFLLANNINHIKWLSIGEKIVVVKTSQDVMKKLLIEYNEKLINSNTLNLFPIFDAGRTEVESGSLTVIVLTPISDDKKPDWLKELKLL